MGIRMRTSYVAALCASLVFTAACGEDDGVFEPATPTTLSIVGGAGQAGAVNFPLEQQLRVRVLSQDGDPMPNVMVTWAVTGGGTLSDSTTLTNAVGEAVVSWTLGSAEGAQTVTASAPGTSPVTFTATASAVAPMFLAATQGNNQSGFALEPLGTSRVILLGSDRSPIVGATVNWTVLTGGGSVNPTSSTTDATGQASTVWTLGPASGEQTMRAQSGNATVVFRAVVDDPCLAARPFSAITAANRALNAGDCLLSSGPRSGSFVEYFTFNAATQQNSSYTVTSTGFDAHLALLKGSDTVAVSDDAPGAGTNSNIRVFLAPGAYRFAVSSSVAGQTGAYTFAQSAVGDVANCEDVFITRGASTAQTITAADCTLYAGYYSDQFKLYLNAGETVTIRMTATLDAYISLLDPAGNLVDEEDSGGTGAETMVFTPAVSGVYTIDAGTWAAGDTGPFTLAIDP